MAAPTAIVVFPDRLPKIAETKANTVSIGPTAEEDVVQLDIAVYETNPVFWSFVAMTSVTNPQLHKCDRINKLDEDIPDPRFANQAAALGLFFDIIPKIAHVTIFKVDASDWRSTVGLIDNEPSHVFNNVLMSELSEAAHLELGRSVDVVARGWREEAIPTILLLEFLLYVLLAVCLASDHEYASIEAAKSPEVLTAYWLELITDILMPWWMWLFLHH
ncbi:MAG: hypothetical protein Q9211_004845 [Gyalolechia sp. 1 TL-2023]